MKRERLVQEIRDVVDGKRAAGDVVQRRWVVHEVVSRHPQVEDDPEAAFYLCAAYEGLTQIFGEVARASKLRPERELNSQGEFVSIAPEFGSLGLDRIQSHYLVERDGESCLVPVRQLTRSEFRAKRLELQAMEHGCREHALQLGRLESIIHAEETSDAPMSDHG